MPWDILQMCIRDRNGRFRFRSLWTGMGNGCHCCPVSYTHLPVLLTEFGGIGFKVSAQQGWGYSSVNSAEEFLEDYRRIMDAVYASKGCLLYTSNFFSAIEVVLR